METDTAQDAGTQSTTEDPGTDIDGGKQTMPPPSHKGVLRVQGAEPLHWDTAQPETVLIAEAAFKAAVEERKMSATLIKPGTDSERTGAEIIREFDPEADEILVQSQAAGG
jgi:hypothetical protein